MKLGILTFHSAHNYGAVLQAYGLQEYLRGKGHEAYVIDYRPDYITRNYPPHGTAFWKSRNLWHCAMGLFNYVVHKDLRLARWHGFRRFYTERLRLHPYHEGMDFHEFDAVLVGSDQVWSPAHTGGGFEPLFFGEGFSCKVIPYAPSCTSLTLSEADKQYLSARLDAMTAVSVREGKMRDVLQPLTRKDITVVVDPSLLAGRECFDRIAVAPNTRRPYVLVYEINAHPEVYRMAKAMARSIGGDVIELVNGMRHYHRRSMREAASPEEFVGYIRHAACVITTSFHGTAFSIMFHTPFYTVMQHTAADNRMANLLTALGLDDRMIDMNATPAIKPLDSRLIDTNLRKLVAGSELFIKEALE